MWRPWDLSFNVAVTGFHTGWWTHRKRAGGEELGCERRPWLTLLISINQCENSHPVHRTGAAAYCSYCIVSLSFTIGDGSYSTPKPVSLRNGEVLGWEAWQCSLIIEIRSSDLQWTMKQLFKILADGTCVHCKGSMMYSFSSTDILELSRLMRLWTGESAYTEACISVIFSSTEACSRHNPGNPLTLFSL